MDKALLEKMFSAETIRELAEAEDAASCKTCGRVVLCGKVICEEVFCELKERRENNA